MDGIVKDRAQTLSFFRLTQAPQFEIISIIIKNTFWLGIQSFTSFQPIASHIF